MTNPVSETAGMPPVQLLKQALLAPAIPYAQVSQGDWRGIIRLRRDLMALIASGDRHV